MIKKVEKINENANCEIQRLDRIIEHCKRLKDDPSNNSGLVLSENNQIEFLGFFSSLIIKILFLSKNGLLLISRKMPSIYHESFFAHIE